MHIFSGHVSVGRGSEGAFEALQLRVIASFLFGNVGGGDWHCWISSHRQDLGPLLPNLWTQVSLFLGFMNEPNICWNIQKLYFAVSSMTS